MVKCPHAKKGMDCYGKKFRNKSALDMHIKYKHKQENPEPQLEVEEHNEELTREDLGLGSQEAEPQEKKDPVGVCSECGLVLYEKVNVCPNCKEPFEE